MLDYDVVPVFTFELDIIDSIILIQGSNKEKALALEGRFIVNYDKNGFQDVAEGKLLYVNSGEKNPYRDLHMILENAAIFICTWKDKLDDLTNSEKRLLVEPINKLNYYQRETVTMSEEMCTYISDYTTNIRSLIASIEYSEISYIVQVLGHQVRHLSLGYYKDVKEYYKKALGKSCNVEEYLPKECDDVSGGLKELWRMFVFYQNENAKIEELRQKLLRANEVKDEKSLYKKSTIFESKCIYKYKIEECLKIMLISRLKGILSPLFLFNVSTCLMDSTKQGDKSYKWKISNTFSVDYYNKLLTAWEPLLEPFNLQCEIKRKTDNEVINITINQCININVTEGLIETLQSYWKLSNAEPSISDLEYFNVLPNNYKPKQVLMKTLYGTATAHAINNQSGEMVYVTTKDQQKIAIPPSKQLSICTVPSEEIKCCSLLRPIPFELKIELDPKLNISPLIWPNLSCPENFSLKSIKDSYQFADTIVDHQKVLTIATLYQLRNELEVPLVVTFYPIKGVPRQHVLYERTMTLSVPKYLINVPAIFSLRNLHKREGHEFTFTELKEKLVKLKFFKLPLETNYNAILSLSTEEDIVRISIWSHLCIYNCLPVPLSIKFNDIEIKFEPLKHSFVYDVIIKHEGKLEISIPNFKTQVITYNLLKKNNVITLADKSRHEIYINMKILVNQKALYSMVFYADYVIKNLTQDNLIFYASTKVLLLLTEF